MPAAPQHTTGVRRLRILQAAIDIFAHKGFEGATWRQIADAANVTQGLIRFYFETKDGLWRAAYSHARARRMAAMPPHAVRDGQASRADVERWLRGYATHVAEHPEESRMLVHDSRASGGQASARLQWAADTYIRDDHRAFTDAVRELKALGWFIGLEPGEVLYLMSGAAQYRFLVPGERLAIAGEDTRDPDTIARHVDAVVTLFMAHAPAEKR